MQINVAVTDANNIVCTVVPPQTQTITIDRGVAGNGIVSIVPVTISTFQYLRITYTDGTVSDVGPLTSTAYTATAPISIVGNTISLLTVPIASGGTAATTAAAAIQNLLPSYTGNGSKRLGLNSGATALEWVTDGGGTVTSVALSGGTTGLTTSGGPITSSGTITLAGTLAIANGGSGQTTAQLAMNAFAGAVTSGSYLRGNGTNVVMATIQAADVPTLNQNTTGTAANITATSNSTLTTLSALSLPGSQVSGNISGNAANVTGTVAIGNGGTGQTTAAAAITALTGTQTSAYYLRSNGTNATLSALSAADLTGAVSIATGGTGQTTANAAFNALAPSQTGNSGKYLTTDGTNTSWATNPLGTVTSVSGTGTVSGLTLTGTVTTSGSLTLGGTLDLSSYNGAGAFTTLSASSTVTLSGGTANGVAYLNGSKVLTSGSALTYDGTTFTSGAHTLSTGNLNFSSTAQRITGNFSSATHSNRLLFQDSTTGGASVVGVIPNGAGVSSAYNAYAAADPTNTSIIQIRVGTDTSDARITSGITGTGTYLPMTFYTGGSERVRIDTSGNVGVATTATLGNASLNVNQGIVARTAAASGITPYLQIYNGNASTDLKTWRIGGSGSGGLTIETVNDAYSASTQRLGIDSAGNVGIGVAPYATGMFLYRNVAGLVYSDVQNPSTTNGTDGAIFRLISSNVAGSGTIAVDLVKYKNGLFAINNNETNLAASTTFGIGGTTRMTLDSSGNVGIGTNSPAQKLDVVRSGTGIIASFGANSVQALLTLEYDGSQSIVKGSTFGPMSIQGNTGQGVIFYTNGANARGQFTSAGDFLINTTATGGWSGDATMSTLANGSTRAWGISAYNNTASNGGALLARVDNTSRQLLGLYYSTTNVGSITTNGTITVYNTTSDYRLKTVIGPIIDAGQRIDALEPIEYTWDSNGSRTRGFLAHKFQEVYANSVTGTKDEIDADGKPVYQGMQAGSAEVIADLVSEIQSLRKRLTALEGKA